MINGIPDDIQATLAMLDELSGTRTCNRTSPVGADGPGRSRYTHATPVRPSRSSSPHHDKPATSLRGGLRPVLAPAAQPALIWQLSAGMRGTASVELRNRNR